MLNNIQITRYIKAESFLHERHSVTKLICSFLLFFSLIFVSEIETLVFYTLFLFIVMYLSGIPFPIYGKMIIRGKYFYIVLFFLYLLCGLNPLNSVIMVVRIIYMMVITFVLILTTSPSEITFGLEQILKPLEGFHVDVRGLSFSISLALRFIPMILEEADFVLKSLKSRGFFNRKRTIKERLFGLKAFLIPIFTITMRNADTLADAMEVRLYRVHAVRTNYRTSTYSWKDSLIFVVSIIIVISLVLKETIL